MPKFNIIDGGSGDNRPWLLKLNVRDVFITRLKTPISDWVIREWMVAVKVDGDDVRNPAVRLVCSMNGQPTELWVDADRYSRAWDLIKVLGNVPDMEPTPEQEQETKQVDDETGKSDRPQADVGGKGELLAQPSDVEGPDAGSPRTPTER